MKVLLTAGTFDSNGGKKSGLIEKMYLKLKEYYLPNLIESFYI